MIPTLTTERLTLRAPTASDFEDYRAFYASERARHVGGPTDLEGAWKLFATDVGHWCLKGFGWWCVVEGDRPVGHVGVHHPPQRPEPELGWLVFEEGKGYAREAAEAARTWWRETHADQPLVSYIHRENDASIRLAEHLGATPDPTPPPHFPAGITYRHWGQT